VSNVPLSSAHAMDKGVPLAATPRLAPPNAPISCQRDDQHRTPVATTISVIVAARARAANVETWLTAGSNRVCASPYARYGIPWLLVALGFFL